VKSNDYPEYIKLSQDGKAVPSDYVTVWESVNKEDYELGEIMK
jgi:hypothetical protein